MMTWTEDELSRIGKAVEPQLASARSDGTLRPYVTTWVVRAGGTLYVRSAYGSTNPWYLRAKASGVGRVRAGGSERGVTFADADPSAQEQIDTAYERLNLSGSKALPIRCKVRERETLRV